MRTRMKTTIKDVQAQVSAAMGPPAARDVAPPDPHRCVYILPRRLSNDARFISAPITTTTATNRYIVCPETGFYELINVSAAKTEARSWLVMSQADDQQSDTGKLEKVPKPEHPKPFIIRSPDYFVATPLDPLFFLLPVFAPSNGKAEYLAFSDYLTRLGEIVPAVAGPNRPRKSEPLYSQLLDRLRLVCDVFEVEGDSMYALDIPKLVQVLVSKAHNLADSRNFPASAENHFVDEALRAPVMTECLSARTGIPAKPGVNDQAEGQLADTVLESGQDPRAGNICIPMLGKITGLLRLRTSLDFILNLYVPTALRETLNEHMKCNGIPAIDFTPLDVYLSSLKKSKEEARTLRSLSDNISRKRPAPDNTLATGESKRPKADLEATKKNLPVAIKQLSKVNTTGMKKLNTFFATATNSRAKGK